MSLASFICHLCSQVYSERVMYAHTTKCVYQASKKDGVPCNCTCEDCKGEKLHPPQSNLPLPSSIPKPNPITIPPPQGNWAARDADQLRGVTCLCCGEKKDKALPQGQDTMGIGKYRVFRLCMKTELREAITKGNQ
jgi:hypothetical protein